MKKNNYSIDIFKTFKLETPITGLIKQITSPKGVRTAENDCYSYHLRTKLCCIYKGSPCELESGIYHVLDLCKPYDKVVWNHYLFIIDPDGFIYPAAEYIEQVNSLWVKDAIQVVKAYFNGEVIDRIDLTPYTHEEEENTSWKSYKK